MSVIDIELEEFLELKTVSEDRGFGNSKTLEHVYSILRKYKDQKVFYRVKGVNERDTSIINIYKKFGILLEDSIVLDFDRHYLLIMDPLEVSIDLKKYCNEFVEEYLPRDEQPTHYILDKKIKDYEELIMWERKIREIYENVEPLSSYSELIKENYKSQDFGALLKEVKDKGFDCLLITDYVDELYHEFSNGNRRTLEVFDKVEKDIISRAKNNTVLMYNGDPDKNSIATTICAYLFFKKGIHSFLSRPQFQSYLTKLSNLFFDRNTMLVEDQISFIKNLPDMAISFDPDKKFEYFVFLEKSKMTCKFELAVMDLEDGDNIELIELDLEDILVIPLTHEINLDTTNISSFRVNHDKLLSTLIKLEERYSTGKLMDVTNTFILELEGTKKIAFIENINLSLPTVHSPLHPSMSKASIDLDINDLQRLYPTNIMPDFKERYKKHVIELMSALREVMGDNKKNTLRANMYKHKNSYGIILREFNNFRSNLLNVHGYSDFITLGLWWMETYKYRVGLCDRLQTYMDIKKSRKFNTFFSIFGGPFAPFGDFLLLREEVLKEW